jgi:hypothetical protein
MYTIREHILHSPEFCTAGVNMKRIAAITIAILVLGIYAGPVTAEQPCDCRCKAYSQEKEIPACQSKCGDWWQQAQCEAEAEEASGQDAEAERYAAELAGLGVEGSMYDIQMQAFNDAPPHLREKMWNDLEIVRQTLAEEGMTDLQQGKTQGQSDHGHDTETLRYKAELEAAGMTEAEVNGLVSLFAMSDEQIREVLWKDLQSQNP